MSGIISPCDVGRALFAGNAVTARLIIRANGLRVEMGKHRFEPEFELGKHRALSRSFCALSSNRRPQQRALRMGEAA